MADLILSIRPSLCLAGAERETQTVPSLSWPLPPSDDPLKVMILENSENGQEGRAEKLKMLSLPRMGVGIQGKFPSGGNLWTEPSWTSLGIRRGSRQENGTWKGERGWAWQVAGTPLPVVSISIHPRWTPPPSTGATCAMWGSGRPCRRRTGTVSFSTMWTCSQRMTTTSASATSSLPLFHGHRQVQRHVGGGRGPPVGGTLGQALPIVQSRPWSLGPMMERMKRPGERPYRWGEASSWVWVSNDSGISYQWGDQDAFNEVVGREVVTEVRGELITGGTIDGVTRWAFQMIQGGDFQGYMRGHLKG